MLLKMKMGLLLILMSVCTLVPGYHAQMQSPDIRELAFKNMDFAMNLYRKISSYHDKNIFFSPLSISTAFAVLSMASDGLTHEEILKGLNLAQLERDGQPELIPELFQFLNGNITQDGSLKLDQGTALFVQQQFRVEKTFSDQIKMFFNADINSVDFADTAASIAIINEYIKQNTGNKVTEMISTLDGLTQLLLVNTIFFQGKLVLFSSFPKIRELQFGLLNWYHASHLCFDLEFSAEMMIDFDYLLHRGVADAL